jgi:hypothetical protein
VPKKLCISKFKDIRKRQSDFFGHIIRKEKNEQKVITGNISWRRDRETTGEDFGFWQIGWERGQSWK